eukprot:TRINITY_DN38404_c0_g1_i1.p1 TRINITY_DN38404_c0_g1~~TRINITY_DN38404_c0_g1_i1.p1  ORF type:complete len:187 (+),score=23.92 TRINITY_DN38404_c0_g1_i1:55-615(+)
MGIDIEHRGKRKKLRPTPKSNNVYLGLLVELYEFLSRRTDSAFNKTVHKRLLGTNINRPPVSTSRIAYAAKGKKEGTIIATVAKVVDDKRFLDLPKVTVCALGFSEGAAARIRAAGGQTITFDQLAVQRPTGSNVQLIRGRKTARVATKYFGAPGTKGSHTRPKVLAVGRTHETARGRRNSRGFSN